MSSMQSIVEHIRKESEPINLDKSHETQRISHLLWIAPGSGDKRAEKLLKTC